MGDEGWPFAVADEFPGADKDPNYDSKHVKDLYLRADPDYSGRCVYRHCCGPFLLLTLCSRFTVPVLWDKKQHTIANNESSEIIRMFNSAFNDLIPKEKADLDFYPANHRTEIDGVNEWVYDTINSQFILSSPSLSYKSH